MRRSELKTILDTTGYPAAFRRFMRPRPPLPFILFMRVGSANFFADDLVYVRGRKWRVVLASEYQDDEAEQKLEAALDSAGICYELVDDAEVESEGIYQAIYEFSEMEG